MGPDSNRDGGVIAPEGVPFIAGAVALTAVLYYVWPRSLALAVAGLVLTAFVSWFFRNPERTPPPDPRAVVSPADGKIVFCGDCAPGIYSAEPGKKVSVFMSIFDVHVNRAPVSGRVAAVRYNKGKFLVANVDKASLENEQNGVIIETAGGRKVVYVQIAGLVARRIVCDLAEGDPVERGQRVGLIRFGSRVDVYLPANASLSVRKGDRVRAGESVLGELP